MEKNVDTEKVMERTFNATAIEHFSERLKIAMKGMSNHELARRSGLSEAAIRKYVKGESFPTIDNAAKVADACGVSLSWLLVEQEVSRPSCNIANSSTYANIGAQSAVDSVSLLLSSVSSSDVEHLFQALCNVGIKGILSKLRQADKSTADPHTQGEPTMEELEAMIMALPVRESLKIAFSRGLSVEESADKEILRILESYQRGISPEGDTNSAATPDPSLNTKAG